MSKAQEHLKMIESIGADADSYVDNDIDEINQHPINKFLSDKGLWGSVKTILAVLRGNGANMLAGSFLKALKERKVKNFYIDSRVQIKQVRTGYGPAGVTKLGKREFNAALKDLQSEM